MKITRWTSCDDKKSRNRARRKKREQEGIREEGEQGMNYKNAKTREGIEQTKAKGSQRETKKKPKRKPMGWFCWPTVSVLSSPSSPHFCLLFCAFSVLFLLPFLVQPRHRLSPLLHRVLALRQSSPFRLRFVLTLLGPSFCVIKLVHSVPPSVPGVVPLSPALKLLPLYVPVKCYRLVSLVVVGLWITIVLSSPKLFFFALTAHLLFDVRFIHGSGLCICVVIMAVAGICRPRLGALAVLGSHHGNIFFSLLGHVFILAPDVDRYWLSSSHSP